MLDALSWLAICAQRPDDLCCCLLYVCIDLSVVCLPTAYHPLVISGWLVMLCLQFLLIHVDKMAGLLHEEDIFMVTGLAMAGAYMSATSQPKCDLFLFCLDHHRPHSSKELIDQSFLFVDSRDVSLLAIMIIEIWYVRYPKNCCCRGARND
jgi:hypothetical protein